jgi:hypothetical protein
MLRLLSLISTLPLDVSTIVTMNIADLFAILLSVLMTWHTVLAAQLFRRGYQRLWELRYEILGDPASGLVSSCQGPHSWRSPVFSCELSVYWWRSDKMTPVCSDHLDSLDLKAATASRRRYRIVYQCQFGKANMAAGAALPGNGVYPVMPPIETLILR